MLYICYTLRFAATQSYRIAAVSRKHKHAAVSRAQEPRAVSQDQSQTSARDHSRSTGS